MDDHRPDAGAIAALDLYAPDQAGGLLTAPLDDSLAAAAAALGAEQRPAVVYCGSGVNACRDLLALHLAGLGGQLYAGSWSEWSADEALPVETGGA